MIQGRVVHFAIIKVFQLKKMPETNKTKTTTITKTHNQQQKMEDISMERVGYFEIQIVIKDNQSLLPVLLC